MKKLVLISILFLSVLSSCGVKIYTKKDNVSRRLEVKGNFTAIETRGMTDVIYQPGSPSIVLKAPKDFLSNINVYIENGTLIIENRENKNLSYVGSSITVTWDSVSKFTTLGTGDIDIKNLNTNDLTLYTYGTGDIECKESKCTRLYAETGGTGDIEIKDMNCESAKLITEGTGDIEVVGIKASGLINACTLGTGDIEIIGTCGALSKDKSGTGSININRLKVGGE